MRPRCQRPSVGLLCWLGIGVTTLGAFAQSSKSVNVHEPVVTKLIDLLDERSHLRDTLEQAIVAAAIEDFDSLDGLYEFVDGLVTEVPVNNVTVPKVLRLHFAVNQAPGDALN